MSFDVHMLGVVISLFVSIIGLFAFDPFKGRRDKWLEGIGLCLGVSLVWPISILIGTAAGLGILLRKFIGKLK